MNDIQNDEIVETKPLDNRLKSFIERVERFKEEKFNILAHIKEVYSESKSSGYDPKIMREVITIRKIKTDERLDTYRNVLGIF